MQGDGVSGKLSLSMDWKVQAPCRKMSFGPATGQSRRIPGPSAGLRATWFMAVGGLPPIFRIQNAMALGLDVFLDIDHCHC